VSPAPRAAMAWSRGSFQGHGEVIELDDEEEDDDANQSAASDVDSNGSEEEATVDASVSASREAAADTQAAVRAQRRSAAKAMEGIKASQQAQRRLREEDEGASDDSLSDSGAEETEEAEEDVETAAPLSAYELQRQRNISANQQVLASLGLLQGANELASQSSGKKRAKRPKTPSTGKEPQQPRKRSPRLAAASTPRQSSRPPPEAPSSSTTEDTLVPGDELEGGAGSDDWTAEKAFDQLRGEVLTREGLLTVQALLRLVGDLHLDLDYENVRRMVDAFDTGGKGGLTLDEFKVMWRQLVL